jgi:hypothetical protein
VASQGSSVGEDDVVTQKTIMCDVCIRHNVGEDDVVTQKTIMCDVCIRHNERVIAHHRLSATTCRAPVNGGELPNDRVITNKKMTFLSMELEILWLRAENGMGKDSASATDLCPSVYDYVRPNAGPLTNAHLLPYDRQGTNGHTLTKLGCRGHNRCGMKVY